MGKMNTAERVSREMSDNFVFQRSLLAYHAAAQRIGGDVLEIGTGAGYGIEVVAPHARSFITVDKFAPAAELMRHPHVEFHQAVVPPLAFAANSFDFVISFQVIEHVKQDIELVRQVHRDDPQCTDVAHPQPMARTGIYGGTIAKPAGA